MGVFDDITLREEDKPLSAPVAPVSPVEAPTRPLETPPAIELPTQPVMQEAPPTAPTEGPKTGLFSNPEYRVDPTPPNTGTADQIRSNPETMANIRQYMTNRKGQHIQDYNDDELYDAFVNHSRWFNVNEVVTVGELMWIRGQDEEGKAVAASAYEAFESLGNVLTNDGVLGALDGVTDYARALVMSPTSLLSLGAGRLATRAPQLAARKKIMDMTAAAVATTRAAPAGTTAALTATNEAVQQVAANAARSTALRQVAAATITDAALATGQDYAYQSTLINSGAQDKYNMLQTILSAGLGVAGGVVATVPIITRNRALAAPEARVSLAQETAKVQAAQRALPLVQQAAKNFQTQLKDWLNMAANGKVASKNDNDFGIMATQMLLDTDPQSTTSLVGAMMKAGYGLDSDLPAVQQIASFATNIPAKDLKDLDDIFKAQTGLTFNEVIDVMVQNVRESGQTLKLSSDAAKALNEAMAARKAANTTINAAAKTKILNAPMPAKRIEYLQSVWRRALVSHPATTAVNVLGWGQAQGFRTLAELLHGGILGTSGLAAKLMSPVSTKAGQWADKSLLESKALFSAQTFKLRTLMDPYSTKEAFEAIIKSLPAKEQKKISASLFGGVEDSSPSMYNMKDSRAVRSTEKLLDHAATFSMLKMQDTYTKSASFMQALDLSLKKNGMGGINKVMDSGKFGEIPQEAFDDAMKAALKDTFSTDYTKGYGNLSKIARWVEDLSNLPGIGFMFPFGRFMNNQLAFIMEYTPLSMMPLVSKARATGHFSGSEVMESVAKMTVGMAAMGQLMQWERETQESGLQWYEALDNTGAVINRQNLAPISAYMVAARLMNSVVDGQVNESLILDLAQQLGPFALLRETENDPLGAMAGFINELADDTATMTELGGAILSVFGAIGTTVVSGFTRPLEPINALSQMLTGNADAVDRNQFTGPERVYRGALRYVENLFTPFFVEPDPVTGERIPSPVKQDATKLGVVEDPNPLSRLLGRREQQPLTEIDRLLARVNIPPWSIQERSGVPEWDALVNEIITPRLNRAATQMMADDLWKNSSAAGRERLVRNLLKSERDHTIAFVEREMSTNENLLLKRQSFLRLQDTMRREARRVLDIQTPDRQLSAWEITVLTQYIEDLRRREKQP